MPAFRCPLWLKSANRGVPPCLGSEFTLAQYSGNCPLFPCSLLLGELRCCLLWVLLWPYHTLPCLHCTGSLLSYWVTCRYLTFLAVDWLRTVSASTPLCFCLACCFLPAGLLLSFLVSPFLSVGLCWAVRPFPSPFPFGPYFPRCFLCLLTCLPGWFGLPCVVICTCITDFFLAGLPCLVFCTLGLVPGLSGP